MSSGVILLQRPYIYFSSPLLLILRREITAAAVALFYFEIQCTIINFLIFMKGPGYVSTDMLSWKCDVWLSKLAHTSKWYENEVKK